MNWEQYVINDKVVWRGRVQKIGGIALKQYEQPHFIIRPLAKKDTKAMSDLSSVIYSHLSKGEECFIHKHDNGYYRNIFNNKDISYIGIFVGSKLVGMSYLRICGDEHSLNEEIPNNPVNIFDKKKNGLAASLGADCVHPDYRGNKLNQIMIQYRVMLAQQVGCTDVFSIIDRNNCWNMEPYFNNSFQMYACTIDPVDGGKIALMRSELPQQEVKRKMGIGVAYGNLEQIDKMLSRGFIGTSYDRKNKTINFVKEDVEKEKSKLQNISEVLVKKSLGRGYNV